MYKQECNVLRMFAQEIVVDQKRESPVSYV